MTLPRKTHTLAKRRALLPFRCDSAGQFLRLVCFWFSHQPSVFKTEGFLWQQLKRLENCAQWDDGSLAMKSQLVAIVAAVVLMGCGESQQLASAPETHPTEPVAEVSVQLSPPPKVQLARSVAEAQPKQLAPPVEVEPAEPVAEPAKPEPPTAKAPEPPSTRTPDISITQAAETGNIEAIKQHLAAGADVNTMAASFHRAAYGGHKDIIELLITNGMDVNAKNDAAETSLHHATTKEIAELLIANGANVNATTDRGTTPLDWAANDEIASLIRKNGGKSGGE